MAAEEPGRAAAQAGRLGRGLLPRPSRHGDGLDRQARSSFQEFTHSVYGTHYTSRPSRQVEVGVVQYHTLVQ